MDGDYSELLPLQARVHEFPPEDIILKSDPSKHPFYVTHDALIILETSHTLFSQATDFLVAVAEPVSRPEHIHEYRLTGYSLYAAVCVGLCTNEILSTLDFFSKNLLPKGVVSFVISCSSSFGLVRLVVQGNLYYLFTDCSEVLNDSVISRCVMPNGFVKDVERVRRRCVEINYPAVEEFDFRSNTTVPSEELLRLQNGNEKSSFCETSERNSVNIDHKWNSDIGKSKEKIQNDQNHGKIHSEKGLCYGHREKTHPKGNPDSLVKMSSDMKTIDKRLSNLSDSHFAENQNLGADPLVHSASPVDYVYPTYGSFSIDLRPSVSIRSYQETCLNKMFSSGRARSGIIVLPCGAGKTLVGITAIATMKHPALVLCTSGVSVEQWRAQLLQNTTVKPSDVYTLTADRRDEAFENAERGGDAHSGVACRGVTITTYTMLAYTGRRAAATQRAVAAVTRTVWGLLVLDEVHVVPATMFRRVVSLRHYARLGLTATLVREDARISDLHFLIGPRLFEADWQALCAAGHIARVKCIEAWCRMSTDFFASYITAPSRVKRLLAVLNPGKFRMAASLIAKHELAGDKVIVFSDNIHALRIYATTLKRPFIYGPTGQPERMRILQQFQHSKTLNTIFLSKVGDTSIDLPEATVLIQISSHFGSRRQEAQRLGRILRAKRRSDPSFYATFYTLVSQDTDEMFYAAKRQQFLVNQGYSFEVMQDMETNTHILQTRQEEKELLASILTQTKSDSDEDSETWKESTIKAVSDQENTTYHEKRRK